MYPHICHVFIDGGYLRKEAEKWDKLNVHPLKLANKMVGHPTVQGWANHPTAHQSTLLGRITYYDALPGKKKDAIEDEENEKENAEREAYWRAIELLPDVHLGFGELRGLKRPFRQKGVDTLIAVDVLVGAFSELFDVAVLVTGDADFTPVVEEVRRRGVMVAIAGVDGSVSDDLRRVADRYIEIDSQWLKSMEIG